MFHHSIPVAIVGSGPYGISIAAHLRARGVPFRIFGPPMRTWLRMPKTLNLKSFGFATSISVPAPNYTFPEYCRARGLEDFDPCTMESFTQYGLWIQQQLVPEVEPVEVAHIEASGGDFLLQLATGEELRARRVVIAVGLNYFTRLPDFVKTLPEGRGSHSSEHSDYARFKDKDVAVIGAGSSALEAAAVLHESGARAQVLVRGAPPIFFDRIKARANHGAELRPRTRRVLVASRARALGAAPSPGGSQGSLGTDAPRAVRRLVAARSCRGQSAHSFVLSGRQRDSRRRPREPPSSRRGQGGAHDRGRSRRRGHRLRARCRSTAVFASRSAIANQASRTGSGAVTSLRVLGEGAIFRRSGGRVQLRTSVSFRRGGRVHGSGRGIATRAWRGARARRSASGRRFRRSRRVS
jgi:hypothetical protein